MADVVVSDLGSTGPPLGPVPDLYPYIRSFVVCKEFTVGWGPDSEGVVLDVDRRAVYVQGLHVGLLPVGDFWASIRRVTKVAGYSEYMIGLAPEISSPDPSGGG